MDLTMLYTPREWKVYELEIRCEAYEELRALLLPTDLKSCGADSQYAKNHFMRTGSVDGLFFFDTEQIFMDMDKTYGEMALGHLSQKWGLHPEGSLVFVVAKGAGEGKFTVGVEKR